jgi:hypothetical protein
MLSNMWSDLDLGNEWPVPSAYGPAEERYILR